jgi:hypothetical protein
MVSAICSECEQDMFTASSCITDPLEMVDGQLYEFVLYGTEDLWAEEGVVAEWPCRDCGVAPGGSHHPGCCVERCPRCKGQMFGCPCTAPPSSGRGFRPMHWTP